MALPVVVVSHGNQECNALATILWDNAFTESVSLLAWLARLNGSAGASLAFASFFFFSFFFLFLKHIYFCYSALSRYNPCMTGGFQASMPHAKVLAGLSPGVKMAGRKE